jgi:hypothetical protein
MWSASLSNFTPSELLITNADDVRERAKNRIVILSEAKDLLSSRPPKQVLRLAQDDKCW